MEVVLSS